MNYIWDIVLTAKQNGIKKSELFFQQGKEVSPYYEQSFTILNQKEIDSTTIEINALYRFDQLFSKYLNKDFEDKGKFKTYFFDLVIHFLCEIDLAKGMGKESLYLAQIEDEIKDGVLGKDLKEKFTAFSNSEKDKLITILLRQLKIGASLTNFRKALITIYPDTILYQIKDEPGKLLVYLGIKKAEQEQMKIDFLQEILLPLEFQPRIFWDKHFGVCNVDATLVMDEIELV